MTDEPTNLGNKAQVKNRTDKEKEVAKARAKDLRKILELPEGMRFFQFLLTECHVFNSVYAHQHAEMAAREGQRQIGLQLLTEIGAANKQALANILISQLTDHGNQP